MTPELPVYRLVCRENDPMTELERIDLVDRPAIMENWMLLSAEQRTHSFSFSTSSDEQRIITGPVLIPDLLIERYQPVEQGGQPIRFYAVVDKETIRATAKMYARNRKLGDVGLMHKQAVNDGVFMFQSFVSDAASGISNPKAFDHLPDGTWFMSFLVDDDAIWQAAKEGKLNGFSIQAMFGLESTDEEAEIAASLAVIADGLEKIGAKYRQAIH